MLVAYRIAEQLRKPVGILTCHTAVACIEFILGYLLVKIRLEQTCIAHVKDVGGIRHAILIHFL